MSVLATNWNGIPTEQLCMSLIADYWENVAETTDKTASKPSQVQVSSQAENKNSSPHIPCKLLLGAGNRTWTCMNLHSYGPEPYASANSAIPAYYSKIFYHIQEDMSTTFFEMFILWSPPLHFLERQNPTFRMLRTQKKKTSNAAYASRFS